MTEQKAIEILEYIKYGNDYKGCAESVALDMAIKSLKKQSVFDQIKWERDVALEQLEMIGVGLGRKMDEVKESLEKQIPKKVVNVDRMYDYAECPSCGAIATDIIGCLYRWCRKCGQKLKRSDEE